MGAAVVDHGAEEQRQHGQADDPKYEHPNVSISYQLFCSSWSLQYQLRFNLP
jgi:hypothetical protein